MVCDHLAALESALLEAGVSITFRGASSSKNCREWGLLFCSTGHGRLQERFKFAACVAIHVDTDSKSGQERGFECTQCNYAAMGLLEGGTLFR